MQTSYALGVLATGKESHPTPFFKVRRERSLPALLHLKVPTLSLLCQIPTLVSIFEFDIVSVVVSCHSHPDLYHGESAVKPYPF